MLIFVSVVVIIVIFDWKRLIKNNSMKDTILFGSLVIATLALGTIYLSSPNKLSFSKIVFEVLKIKY